MKQHTTRRKLNKRAKYFSAFIFIGVVFVAVYGVVMFYDKYTDDSKGLDITLGEKSLELFSTYQQGEEFQFMLSLIAKYQSLEAALPLARNGGFIGESPCGRFGGYNLWNKEDVICMSGSPGTAHARYLGPLLKETVKESLPLLMPADTFHVYSDTDTIVGVSSQDIRFGLTGQPLLTYSIPQDQATRIEKSMQRYDALVQEELSQNGRGQVTDAMVHALIATTSQGDPNYISPELGCAGLIPACYAPLGYLPPYFQKKAFCECQGDACKTQAKCNPSNDDRFDPEKSIKYGVFRFQDIYQSFNGYTEQEALAYAAFAGDVALVKEAIQLTGKTDPTFAEVSVYITPTLIEDHYRPYIDDGYFSTRSAILAKTQQIKKYPLIAIAAREHVELTKENKEKAAAMTGAVTVSFSQTGTPDLPGYYYLKPAFSIKNHAGLDRYQIIHRELGQLLIQCQWDRDCLQNGLADIQQQGFTTLLSFNNTFLSESDYGGAAEQDWLACETPSEKELFDFLAFYQGCAASVSKDCICQIDATTLWDQRYGSAAGVVTFQKDKQGSWATSADGKTRILLDLSLLDQSLDEYSLSPQTARVVTDRGTIASSALTLYKATASGKPDKLTFIDAGTVPPVNACLPSSQYRACVKDERTVAFVYNKAKDQLDTVSPTMRFAIHNKGTPPPKVEGFKAVDAFREEQSLFLTWQHIDDPNVMGYHLYFDDQSMDTLTNQQIRAGSVGTNPNIRGEIIPVGSLKAETGLLQLADLGLKSECVWDPAQETCSYRLQTLDAKGKPTGVTTPFKVEKGKPYLFNNEQIVYLPTFDDGVPQSLTVLAVSPNGLESEDQDIKGMVASFDDFPPPPCEQDTVVREGNPPDEKMVFRCSFQERKDDPEQLFIDYKITFTPGGNPAEHKVQKPLTFSPNHADQTGELPKITTQDWFGQPIEKIEYRILAKQLPGSSQEEMWDRTYYTDHYSLLVVNDYPLFVDPAVLPATGAGTGGGSTTGSETGEG